MPTASAASYPAALMKQGMQPNQPPNPESRWKWREEELDLCCGTIPPGRIPKIPECRPLLFWLESAPMGRMV